MDRTCTMTQSIAAVGVVRLTSSLSHSHENTFTAITLTQKKIAGDLSGYAHPPKKNIQTFLPGHPPVKTTPGQYRIEPTMITLSD